MIRVRQPCRWPILLGAGLLLLVLGCDAARSLEGGAASPGSGTAGSTQPAAASHTLVTGGGPRGSHGGASTPLLREPGDTWWPSRLGRILATYIHRHKHLRPLSWWDAAGFAATAASLVLAASGGIGGGGLLIPIYMLVFGFRTVTAVALSNITIVGGTLTNFAFNVGRRNPLKPGPLIDWDLILVMEPSTILGAILGGYINHILPAWLTTVALSVLLAFVTWSLLRRGTAAFRKETRQLFGATSGAGTDDREPKPTDDEDYKEEEGGSGGEDSGEDGIKGSPRLGGAGGRGPLMHANSRPIPVPHFGDHDEFSDDDVPAQPPAIANPAATAGTLAEPLLGSATAQECEAPSLLGTRHWRARQSVWTPEVPLAKFSVLVALLAGVVVSDTVRTNLPCPSPGYWLAAASMVPATLLVLLGVRRYLVHKHSARSAGLRLAPVEGEVAWNARTTLVYPVICTVAGVAAGLFGVGGGIIKGPLMLAMGVHPQVAAATSATMILFTSASAACVFISFGAVMWDYATVLFSIALVFTAVGQLATKWIMRRMHGRSSIIIFAMAAIMGSSAAVLAVQGAIYSQEAFAAHRAWDWGSVCKAAPA